MEAPSTSKVPVTYWDPSSLFPLISADLRARLPLRNLHWKASSRSLRSINSLHVDLVPFKSNDSLESPANPPAGSLSDLTRVKSSDSRASTDSTIRRSSSRAPAPQKERRHQIPGLRNTPYLKIFLLRCDDNETYKATSRKTLREWVNTHASTSSTDHNHDAFEWLIIHIVLPNTPASMQPRSSSSSGSGNNKWLKGNTTLLDKIRSDFNISSSKKDRVIQIRIPPSNPALATLSPPVMIGNQIPQVHESPTESEVAWLDMISKFKSQILTSFDARVAQYEEDIREKDSQRRLPGWNFCTFFVLKEGLARAFESVGLVEDALVLYDELGFGLEGILRDAEEKNEEDENEGLPGGRFVEWSKENLWALETARKRRKTRLESAKANGKDNGQEEDDDDDETLEDEKLPVEAEKKPYRDLILSNEISVFDFKCYLFARQSALLLRLGKGNAGSVTVGGPSGPISAYSLHEAAAAAAIAVAGVGEEDLLRLAETCRRGMEFVTPVARVLRADLWAGYHALASSEKEKEEEENVRCIIDNMVSSWVFSVCKQLLSQTSSESLPESRDSNPSVTAGNSTSLFPSRTSSLPNTPNADNFSQAARVNQPPLTGITGLEELAAGRAELMILARGVVETVGRRRGWIGEQGWFYIPGGGLEGREDNMEEIDLNADDKDAEKEEEEKVEERDKEDGDEEEDGGKDEKTESTIAAKETSGWGIEGIRSAALRDAIQEKERFYKFFEEMTEKALRNYSLAKRTKSAERIEADLAALKFHLKDYASAAYHFQKMTEFYASQGWGLIETMLLGMYAKCLKEMDMKQEYVRVLLRLLSKNAAAEKGRIQRRRGDTPASEDSLLNIIYPGEESFDVSGYVKEVLSLSDSLGKEIITPMTLFWDDIVIDHFPVHFEDRDGFEVRLKMRYLLEEDMRIETARVRIVNMAGQQREIWMEAEDGLVMKKGIARVGVTTNMTIPGSYIVDRVVLKTGKLTFIHELMAKTTPATPMGLTSSSAAAVTAAKKSRLLFYPSPKSLIAKLELPKTIHLDTMRNVEIVLSVGENELIKGELRVRSATAGLRLMIGSLEFLEGEAASSSSASSDGNEKPGVVGLGKMGKNENLRIRVPYKSETDLTELAVKLEVEYTTEKGTFLFSDALSVQVSLPLAVNVQDVFKPECLFSKFQVSTSIHEVPLRILKAELEGSKSFETECGYGTIGSMVVFGKQPATFVYKITRKSTDGMKVEQRQEPLAFSIEYRRLDEEIQQSVANAFISQLKDAKLDGYTFGLVPILISWLHSKSPLEIEAVALLDEIKLGDYEEYGWDEALENISPALGEREKVEKWLKGFVQKNTIIQVNTTEKDLEAITRSIVIPVDVPQLQVINTVELNLPTSNLQKSLSAVYAPPMMTVGQAIPAELIIHHSRGWNTAGDEGEGESGLTIDDKELEFFYEIQNIPEMWLVSGKKRCHFSAKEGKTHTFPLLLVPLKPGHLLLPNIEVKQFIHPSQQQVEELMVSSETDYKSHGESVLVLPDVRSTTVRIDTAFSSDGVDHHRSPLPLRTS